MRDVVAEAGYATACTTHFGVNTARTPRFRELNRIFALSESELLQESRTPPSPANSPNVPRVEAAPFSARHSALDHFRGLSDDVFMIFRPFGDTGINCSIIGLGTGRLASVSGGISRSGAGRLLGVAEDLGINLIDTADSYGQGE